MDNGTGKKKDDQCPERHFFTFSQKKDKEIDKDRDFPADKEKKKKEEKEKKKLEKHFPDLAAIKFESDNKCYNGGDNSNNNYRRKHGFSLTFFFL